MLPDHATLCSQEMPENTEAHSMCSPLPRMIRYLG